MEEKPHQAFAVILREIPDRVVVSLKGHDKPNVECVKLEISSAYLTSDYTPYRRVTMIDENMTKREFYVNLEQKQDISAANQGDEIHLLKEYSQLETYR